MIILITGWFDEYGNNGFPTGKKLFQVSHGYDTNTGRDVITDNFNPIHYPNLCYFNKEIGEYVIKE